MSTDTTLWPKPSCRDLLKEAEEEVNNENAGWITFLNGLIWIYKFYFDKPRIVNNGERLLLLRVAYSPLRPERLWDDDDDSEKNFEHPWQARRGKESSSFIRHKELPVKGRVV